MSDKEIEKRWAAADRIERAFPKKLDAAAIRTLKADLDGATEKEAKEDAEYAWYLFTEKVVRASGKYANCIMTPRFFAKLRRRNGDSSASPHDYDCRCPIPGWDGVPVCEERRRACKFKGLCRAPSTFYNECNAAWFDAHRGFQKLILRELTPDEPEKLAVGLETLEKELNRECARRKRELGEELKLATNSLCA